MPTGTDVGTHTLSFVASDGTRDSDSLTISIAVAAADAVTDSTDNQSSQFRRVRPTYTVTAGQMLRFRAYATDPDKNSVVLTVTGLPDDATFRTITRRRSAAGLFDWRTHHGDAQRGP